ncbi:MAG: TlpA family protein disulfide reductase [Burkholderiales bacterium]|nr:MAG: TlpA family protein disulfide reductase [Burkholderiales bacterium]
MQSTSGAPEGDNAPPWRDLPESCCPVVGRRAFTTGLAAAAASLCGVLSPVSRAQGLTGPAYEITSWTPRAIDFQLVDTTGKTWRAADLKGRAVLLNFWASWCEPCRAEMPTLQQLADLYGPDKLLVLAINFKEAPARAVQFAATTGITLPVLLDLKGEAAKTWGVKVFPTTLLIDSAGKPRQRVTGEVDWTGQAAGKLVTALFPG